MRRVLITLGLGALAAIGLAAGLLATAARAGSEPNVAICHYVPGNGNTDPGWTLIPNIDQAGAWGHRGNEGNHDGKDIIPPLNFTHGTNQIDFAGQGDQSILANRCTVEEEEEDKGTLIVKKVVVNDNGGTAEADDFSFTVNGRGPVTFDSDGSTSFPVPAGYIATVAEVAAPGYTTTYSATNGGTVEAGEKLTITVTNDDVKKGDEKGGTLVINKILVTDDGAVADESDFSFKVDNRGPFEFESDGSNSYPVPAGDYNVVEVDPGAGWTVTGGGIVEVEEGETTVVTITNNDVADDTETTPTDTTPTTPTDTTSTTPTDTAPTTPTDTTPTTTTDSTPTTTTDTTPTTTTETTPTAVPAAPLTPPKGSTKPAAPKRVKQATIKPTKPTVKVKGVVADSPPKLAYTP